VLFSQEAPILELLAVSAIHVLSGSVAETFDAGMNINETGKMKAKAIRTDVAFLMDFMFCLLNQYVENHSYDGNPDDDAEYHVDERSLGDRLFVS